MQCPLGARSVFPSTLNQTRSSQLGHEFTQAIDTYFTPFLKDLGFALASPISVSGKHYCAEFLRSDLAIIVSYEPGDDYLLVALPSVVSDLRCNLDDHGGAPRLAELTPRVMANASPAQIRE